MASRESGGIVITVEDHYQHGGIGDAVLSALSAGRINARKLAVNEIPRSEKPKELIDKFGLSACHIVEVVKTALQ